MPWGPLVFVVVLIACVGAAVLRDRWRRRHSRADLPELIAPSALSGAGRTEPPATPQRDLPLLADITPKPNFVANVAPPPRPIIARAPETAERIGGRRAPSAKQLRGRGDTDTFVIEYADVDGVVTSREIGIKNVLGMGDHIYVEAFCHLRGDDRTFRADRILSMADGDTGVVVPDIDAVLKAFVSPQEKMRIALSSAPAAHKSVMARAQAGLTALVWIEQGAGGLDEPSFSLLCDYIDARRALRLRGSELAWDRELARFAIKEMAPTKALAAGALAQVSPAGGEAALIRRSADAMVALRGEACRKRWRELSRFLSPPKT